MILIFGGAYQGKLDYALEKFGYSESDVFRCDDETTAMPAGKSVIYELDKWILALIKANTDSDMSIKSFIDNNSDAVVIANDISSGIVPLDPIMRKWREAVGRALAEIARESDEAIRLFCGIPTRIK